MKHKRIIGNYTITSMHAHPSLAFDIISDPSTHPWVRIVLLVPVADSTPLGDPRNRCVGSAQDNFIRLVKEVLRITEK